MVIVGIGAEGITHAVNSVTMTNNTIINEIQGRGILLYNPAGVPVAQPKRLKDAPQYPRTLGEFRAAVRPGASN